MKLTKAAAHVLETVFKGDHNKRAAQYPDVMADSGHVVVSSYRAFRVYAPPLLPQGELTANERACYDNYCRAWDAAIERNTESLKMPSIKELTQFIRENRKPAPFSTACYVFPEGIAFNPHYLRDIHTVLGKVDALMWDQNPYHPATAKTERGLAFLLPCRINR